MNQDSKVIQRKRSSAGNIIKKDIKNILFDSRVTPNDTGPKFGCRHVQALLMLLCLLAGSATKINLSFAVVAMTDNTTSPNPDVPAYEWNNTSVILSSFFWGYISFQILAGYLGKTYGPKYFLLCASLVNYLAVALLPLAAENLGSIGVMSCRILQGFGQGFFSPSAHVLLGRWAPVEERSTINIIMFAGVPLGMILGSLVTGYVSATQWGWPGSFYILAGLGMCWCVLWVFLGQNSPAEHPSITDAEKTYIQSSLKQEDDGYLPIPWKKILKCFPFHVLIITNIGIIWGNSILMTETPTYLAKVMKFDIKSNSLISSIPTIVGLCSGTILGPTSDWLINKKFLSLLNTRKVYQAIGTYCQSVCLIWLSFLTHSQSTLAVVILSLGAGFSTFTLAGSHINHFDLSPRFSGITFGILNAIAQGVSIIGPLSANWILTDPASTSQWQLVFLIAAGMLIAGGTIFVLFASTTRQLWDGPISPKMERRKKVSIVSIF